MTIGEFKDLSSAIQSLATAISLGVGGWWVFRKYIRQQEDRPHIEFTADINLIGVQGDYLIAELIATIENKGKVEHRMSEFDFDLNALYHGDHINIGEQWGGQVDFPHSIVEGSFLPMRSNFFFIAPGVKAKYSYIARVPKEASFLMLHCWFKYDYNRKYGHTAEKTVKVPNLDEIVQDT
ncbi:MAG: hypothetical protein AB1424_04340 [Thermodesulfobacteriota bacterium]